MKRISNKSKEKSNIQILRQGKKKIKKFKKKEKNKQTKAHLRPLQSIFSLRERKSKSKLEMCEFDRSECERKWKKRGWDL